MTVTELKEHYRVYYIRDTKTYSICSKVEHKNHRMRFPYLCSLEKKRDKFAIAGTSKFVSKLEDIVTMIGEHVVSLDWNSDYYNPQYRDGTLEEFVVIDYMNELEFKYTDSFRGIMFWKYKPESAYKFNITNISISIDGLDSIIDSHDEISISVLNRGYTWVSVKCKHDAHEIIKAIDSLIKPLMLSEGISNVNVADKCGLGQFNATIDSIDMNTLDTVSVTYKEELKKKLQTLIDTL